MKSQDNFNAHKTILFIICIIFLYSQPMSGTASGRLKRASSVGRYTVDVASFEELALSTLQNCSESKISTASPGGAAGTSGDCKAGLAPSSAAARLETGDSAKHSVCRGSQELKLSSQTLGTRKCVVVIDEIGKMELLSRSFTDAVRRIFEQKPAKDGVLVMATLPVAGYKPHWLVEELRHRKDCMLFEVC